MHFWSTNILSMVLGYVQHIVDSLLQDDDELQAMLSPQPAPLKALYIYQSKMVSIVLESLYMLCWEFTDWTESFERHSFYGVFGLCVGFIDKSSRVSHRSPDSLTLWTNDSSCGVYSIWYEARCWQVSTVNKYVHLHLDVSWLSILLQDTNLS